MGRKYSKNSVMGKTYNNLIEEPDVKDPLGEVSIDGGIILKLI
jgi:hypothetical protein